MRLLRRAPSASGSRGTFPATTSAQEEALLLADALQLLPVPLPAPHAAAAHATAGTRTAAASFTRAGRAASSALIGGAIPLRIDPGQSTGPPLPIPFLSSHHRQRTAAQQASDAFSQHLLQRRHLHPAKHRPPSMACQSWKARAADAVLAPHRLGARPRLMLSQFPEDLFCHILWMLHRLSVLQGTG